MSESANGGGGGASPWLTADEAAARAQVGRRTIYNEVAAGRLRAARIGGRRQFRFRAEWVDAWLDSTAEAVDVHPSGARALEGNQLRVAG